MAYVPVYEPATPGEVYAMYKEAAALSRSRRMPVILRLTTHVCHAKEKVAFGPWSAAPRDDTPRFDPKAGPYFPITSAVFPLKRRALAKLAEVAVQAETSPANRIDDHGNEARGLIVAGVSYLSLLDVLEGVERKPDILKLGLVHPLPRDLLARFLADHAEVKVLEELDDVLEQQIKALAYERGLKTRIVGKADPEEWIGEYTADVVGTILRRCWPDLLPALPPAPARPAVPPRPAQMCPGCGHRIGFHGIKQALAREDITVADIGCHSLGFLDPYNMGQVLLCMGHSSGTAAGLSLFNTTRKIVAFIGDSTFFHAGLPGLINALFNRHEFTLIVLENGTTAMTGHQDHPAAGRNFHGPVEAIPIRRVLEGLGVKQIWEVDTYQQAKLTAAVKEAVAAPGFKVIIARHPCMLKFMREQSRKGRPRPNPVKVGEACNRQLVCVQEFACPSYQRQADGSVVVEKDLCIGDGSCRQTCPTKAIEPDSGSPKGGPA